MFISVQSITLEWQNNYKRQKKIILSQWHSLYGDFNRFLFQQFDGEINFFRNKTKFGHNHMHIFLHYTQVSAI